ncbi:MAG: DUF3592 domain-containing protein [Vulcanimicrobiota bacterium]
MDDKTRLISPPPRQVPLSIAVKVIFGDFASLFGWIFFGAGMIFFWVFAMNADFSSLSYSSSSWVSTNGVMTTSEQTHFSEGGSRSSRGTLIYANHFRFKAADGNEYEGVSYSKGAYNPPRSVVESNVMAVSVQYISSNPRISRIMGQRLKPLSPNVIFVMIFSIVGFCFLAFGMIQGFKALKLLASGETALGTLKKKDSTNTRINNRRVYALTFSFNTKDGIPATAVARTNEPDKLEDDREERLFYNPINPSEAVLFDSLPGGVGIDGRGDIYDPSPLKSFLYLIIPAIVLLGNAFAVITCFR